MSECSILLSEFLIPAALNLGVSESLNLLTLTVSWLNAPSKGSQVTLLVRIDLSTLYDCVLQMTWQSCRRNEPLA